MILNKELILKSLQDREMDRRFYQRVCMGVIVDAIGDAKRGQMVAREWLLSDDASLIAQGAGLEPGYLKRVVPMAWEPASTRAGGGKRTRSKQPSSGAKPRKLTKKQVAFIKAFRKCGDAMKARFRAEVSTSTMYKWVKDERVKRLMYSDESID